MNEDRELELDLRRALAPAPASDEFKARLAKIAEREIARGPARTARNPWRWTLGFALSGAFGAFALGVWLGGAPAGDEDAALALLTNSDIGYLEALL